MPKFRLATTLACSTLALSALLLSPSQAEACGGTMCDTGPTAMPVDQTGENILFRITDTTVEAHIQIQYDPETEAEKFAWVIPVSALPEFEVGSDLFFTNILNGTVPSYGNVATSDFCGDDGGDDDLGDEGTSDTGESEGDTGGGPDLPNVPFEGSVGAFDVAVLAGGTVEGVMQWLGDNGYQQDPAAEPILAQYIEDDFMFVALKLSTAAEVGEIHPIVLRYEGVTACVPITLTRIAAQEDMDIRVFFLGDSRVVPVNYRHVLVNPLKIDWFNSASNYKEVISMAVDSEEADGNAFVTEYAGGSNVVSTAGVYSDLWDADAFLDLGADPIGVIELLEEQSLIFCDLEWDNVCTTFHPLLQPMLDEFVPVPEGEDAASFYDCMECYADLVDLEAWDAEAFADRLDERIVRPGLNAVDLLSKNSYLTRMYTTISPVEMNVDPIFRSNATLPDVASLRMSTQTLHCDGSTTMELPDSRKVTFPAGELLVWPDFQDEMPWAEDVDAENMAVNTPLISLVDNTEVIDDLLAEWNDEDVGGDGGTGGDGDGGTGDEAGESGGPGADDENAGCACSATDDRPAGGVGFGLALLGLAGLVRRRRS